MRVNVYAEELTDRIEIVEKGGHTGLRFWLALPATYVPIVNGAGAMKPATAKDGEPLIQMTAPFIHKPGDDDSGAVTFWGKRRLRVLLAEALKKLDEYYSIVDAPDEIKFWKISNRRGRPCVEGQTYTGRAGGISGMAIHVYLRSYDPVTGIAECSETGKKYRLT